jgi:hypothetical protein
MPQPIRYKKGELKVGATYLLDRREIALRVAMIIANWADIDHSLNAAYSVMLAGKEYAALAIFENLIDRSARERAFLSVAKQKLPSSLVDEFGMHFDKSKKVAQSRNDVAHALWATLSTRPNSILMCPRNYRSQRVYREIEAMKNINMYNNIDIGVEFIEYTIKDFAYIIDRTVLVSYEINELIVKLNRTCIDGIV